ncbi:MAG: hypothetical protein EHM20_04405 [Alphaproteobacteria bacterium]|nr:MAG: hypothetical protein EHM20_04405 [Alphaproteobacteria bacterium]
MKRKQINKILLLSAFISFNAVAGAENVKFGRVVDLKGEGFISYNGKTREIKKGDTIEIGAEIVIEHQGQVTFTDNADHRFHLGNSSSASVSGNSIELRSGDLWFQSLNKNDYYKVQTANATISYQAGEAIVSYDTIKSKTQLLVINSMMSLANLRAPELNLNVAEGHFSFIDNAYEEGAPRDPTSVGTKTYKELVSLFNGVSPMDKHSEGIFKDHEKQEHPKAEAARAIASVVEHGDSHPASKNEVASKMIEEYKDKLLSGAHPQKAVAKKSVVHKKITHQNKAVVAEKLVVHIYGQKLAVTSSAVKQRAPASVLEQAVPMEMAPTIAAPVTPYSKEYKNQYKESDKLIDDLQKL